MAWVVFDLTGSGALLGAVAAAGAIASPFVMPLAGLTADRFSRNRVVAVSQFLLFLNALALALVIQFGNLHVWHLFAFAITGTVLNGFNMPARQALTFDVVPRELIPTAIALSNIAFNVMRTAGPALAGVLLALFGPSENFMLQSLANLGILVTVMKVSLPKTKRDEVKRSFMRDLVAGYHWILNDPHGRLLFLMMVVYPLFIIPVHSAIIVIFAKDVFDYGAGGLGILLSSLGVGGLLGGIITAYIHRVDKLGLVQLASLLVCGAGLTAFAVVGAATHELWAAVWFLVLSGIGGAVFNTTNQTVVQLVAPNHLRGRITSVLQVQPVCTAIGVIITGSLADVFGAAVMCTFDGLCAVAIGLAVLVFSARMRGLSLRSLVATN